MIDNYPTYKFVANGDWCEIGTMKHVIRRKKQYINAFKYHIRTFPIHKVNV